MQELTGYHKQFKDLSDELIAHGYGELTLRITSMKDNRVRVQINCGKMFVFFIEKEFNPTSTFDNII